MNEHRSAFGPSEGVITNVCITTGIACFITHMYYHANANSLAAAKRSRTPGRTRMPVH